MLLATSGRLAIVHELPWGAHRHVPLHPFPLPCDLHRCPAAKEMINMLTSVGLLQTYCALFRAHTEGSEHVDHFFGSGTAVKIAGEWKWVQWHMSVGSPREFVNNGQEIGRAHV